jgi:hypothetical protein
MPWVVDYIKAYFGHYFMTLNYGHFYCVNLIQRLLHNVVKKYPGPEPFLGQSIGYPQDLKVVTFVTIL